MARRIWRKLSFLSHSTAKKSQVSKEAGLITLTQVVRNTHMPFSRIEEGTSSSRTFGSTALPLVAGAASGFPC